MVFLVYYNFLFWALLEKQSPSFYTYTKCPLDQFIITLQCKVSSFDWYWCLQLEQIECVEPHPKLCRQGPKSKKGFPTFFLLFAVKRLYNCCSILSTVPFSFFCTDQLFCLCTLWPGIYQLGRLGVYENLSCYSIIHNENIFHW